MSALVQNNTVYKVCSSCEIKYIHRKDYEEATTYIGTFKTGKYSEYDLELRNCKCGTTLATYTDKDPSDEAPPVKTRTTKSSKGKLKPSIPNTNVDQLRKKP